MDGSKLTDPLAWAQDTFGAAQLGDPRRTKRLVRVAAQMAADPQGSLPREMGGNWAALKAAYRLVRADGVSHEAISRPVWQQTRQQVEQEPGVMLIVHDDTQLDDGYRPAISGLGPIGNGSHRGFFVHTVLAVVPRGSRERVLGLLHQEAWVRHPAPRQADGRKQSSRQRGERPRESEVWTRAVEQVGSPPAGGVSIQVADGYADMVAFLQRCRQMGTFFLARAAQNRRVLSEEEEALEWILLSALPVESVEQAWQAVHHSSSRWPIEDFHRGVKTGCSLEQRHLQEQRSLENLLAIVSPIAVRLLQLRNLCREEPERPAMVWAEPV